MPANWGAVIILVALGVAVLAVFFVWPTIAVLRRHRDRSIQVRAVLSTVFFLAGPLWMFLVGRFFVRTREDAWLALPGLLLLLVGFFFPGYRRRLMNSEARQARLSVAGRDSADPSVIELLRWRGLSPQERASLLRGIRQIESLNRATAKSESLDALACGSVYVRYLEAILRGETLLPDAPMPTTKEAWAVLINGYARTPEFAAWRSRYPGRPTSDTPIPSFDQLGLPLW